jgi:predicted transcriptional regulator
MKKPAEVKKNTRFEPTLLHEWMENSGVSVGEMARRVGVDKSSIQAWRVGSGLPSLVAAFRLEEVTQVGVPASYWLATTIGRHMYFQMKEKADGSQA